MAVSNAEIEAIVYVSMICSIMSIIAAIISIITQKNILYQQNHVNIQIDVTGSIIQSNIKICKTKMSKMTKDIALLFDIDYKLIEIVPPSTISNGVRLNINICISHSRSIDLNGKKIINDAKNSGKLAKQL